MRLWAMLALLTGMDTVTASDEPTRYHSSGGETHTLEIPNLETPLLVEITELGRDFRIHITSTDEQTTRVYETPGRTLGYTLILIQPGTGDRTLHLVPTRMSSAAGSAEVKLSQPNPDDLAILRTITRAAELYATPETRAASAATFQDASTRIHPWRDWTIFWTALIENEYGMRSEAKRILEPLLSSSRPTAPSLLAAALEARLQMYLGHLDIAEQRYRELTKKLSELARQEPTTYTPSLAAALEYQCVVVRVYLNKQTDACERGHSMAAALQDPYLQGLFAINRAAHEILNLGRPDLALANARQAVEHFESAGDFHLDDAGNAYLTLAKAHEMLGQFAEAKLATQTAMERIEQQERLTNLGWAYRRGAELAERTGDVKRAIAYGERAVEILKGSGDLEMASRAETSLAAVYLSSEAPAAAVDHLRSVMAYQEEYCAEATAESLCGIQAEVLKTKVMFARALAESNSDAAAQATAIIDRAMRDAAASNLPDTTLADVELDVADAYTAMGKHEPALRVYTSAAKRYSAAANNVRLMEALSKRSRLHLSANNHADAIRDAEEVTSMLSRLEIELASERMGPALRASLYDQFAVRIASHVALKPPELPKTIFNIAVESLGPRQVLEELPADPLLEARLTELANAINEAADDKSSQLNITRSVEAVENRLLEMENWRKIERTHVDIAKIQAGLQPNEAVLHYVWWGDVGWVVSVERRHVGLQQIPPLTAADIKDLRVFTPGSANNRYLKWANLTEALFPALSDQVDTLYVIPDGPLRTIPLGALPLSRTSLEPIFSRYVISYASSYENIVTRQPNKVELADGAIIFANPSLPTKFNLQHTGETRQSPIEAPASWLGRVDALPWSEKEAVSIASLFGKGKVSIYKGTQAGRNDLRSARELHKPIWHFATHGYFSSDFADIGGLVLAQSDMIGRPQNGLFTIQDARTAQIRADLVVLNGCETGLGRTLQGEGVMGLTRAFVNNGAANTVSTLWKVPDRAAHEIMTRFYEALFDSNGHDVAAALTLAQREFVASNRRLRWQPAHWGAYIHYQQ